MPGNHTIEKVSDNIYLNVTFNHDPSRGNGVSLATYDVTKTTPIIDKPSDWYCSVIRFDIPLDTLPLGIMPHTGNPLNINETPLIIGILYNGVAYNQNVIYIPDTSLTPNIPTAPFYYYFYSFENVIEAINNALAAAFSAFATANPAAPQVVGGQVAPFFYFDSITQFISLITPVSWATTGATEALIIINNQLLNYLQAFRFKFLGGGLIPGANAFAFIVRNYGNNGYPNNNYPTPPTYLRMTQDYNAVVYWAAIRKIVITTNSIPIVAEYIPTYNAAGVQQTSENQSLPIITDFVPAIMNAADIRSIAYYFPQSQYRLCNLVSETPLNNINLKLWWQDEFGTLYPIGISVYQSASVKIGFFRKSLYKNGGNLLK